MRLSLVIGAVTVALVGCGEAPEQAQEPAGTAGQAEEAALPDVARVVCGPGAPEVTTPAVRPQADGLHVEVVNETGMDLSFSILDERGGGLGDDAPAGASAKVVTLPPGKVFVSCYDPYAGDPSEAPRASFDAVDTDALWVSTRLECAMGFSGTSDYVPGARGEPDPQAVAETALERYGKPGDLIEPAGYPENESPEYRLVRDGDVLAVVELMSDGAGGWLEGEVNGCSSLQSD
jgi:hypothetical protein